MHPQVLKRWVLIMLYNIASRCVFVYFSSLRGGIVTG
jgi:hypothetical protein